MGNLFNENAVFVSKQQSKNAVFTEIYQKLQQHQYVTGNFLPQIIEREEKYPTGLDTSALSHDLPNIALPHTEGEFVNAELIVPIKLITPIEFGNMVDPQQKLDVSFLFMILGQNPAKQASLLADIMKFLADTPVDKLLKLFNYTNPQKIYQFLIDNFY